MQKGKRKPGRPKKKTTKEPLSPPTGKTSKREKAISSKKGKTKPRTISYAARQLPGGAGTELKKLFKMTGVKDEFEGDLKNYLSAICIHIRSLKIRLVERDNAISNFVSSVDSMVTISGRK